MVTFKKLIFGVPFLLTFAVFVYQLNPFFKDTNLIFSLSSEILIQLLTLALSLSLAGLFFTSFSTLAAEWIYVLPVAVLASLSPLLLIFSPEAFILVGGFFLSLLITFFFLQKELKSYFSFNARKILKPAINQMIFLNVLASSLAFYFYANTEISTNGFKLPDSIIDTAIQASGGDMLSQQLNSGFEQNGLPANLSPEMIELAKQNPSLLQQYGIDPKMLDSLGNQDQKGIASSEVIKPIVEQKVQDIIKPFQPFLPLILTLLFFFTVTTLTSLLSLPTIFLAWALFYILEKSGFVTFTTEMREVKKLVV